MLPVRAEDLVETVREGLLVLDADFTVLFANRAFYRAFSVQESETIGRKVYDLGDGQWDIPALRTLLESIIPTEATVEATVESFEVDHTFSVIGRRLMRVNARKLYRPGNNMQQILLAIEDVTERRKIEAERTAALEQAEGLLQELNHRVMNSLSIISSVISMEARLLSDGAAQAAFARVAARVMAVAELYKTLSSSKSAEAVDSCSFLGAICDDVVNALQAERAQIRLETAIDTFSLSSKKAIAVGLVLNELLTNAVKYAFIEREDGEINVTVRHTDGEVRLSVLDNGAGIDENARVDSGVGGKLIDMFSRQLDGQITRHSDSSGTNARLVFPLV
ncbi:histidine kinase dimerization/phosphoacceptor domain -containing protein [Aurantimonas sp. E1-2-R+4]|uniref:sensor histidine kinase n=1 Tax=Aurantimonas sp. E1-2-R+4 TaxID=3113714 RepID=UPI002F9265C0